MNWFKQKGKLVNKAFDSLDNNLDNNLSDEYIREHRILKGKFSHRQWRESQSKWTNTTTATQAEDWSITYKGKKYTSPTQEFEFILEDDLIIDEPWFFTGEPHEGNSPFRAKLFESLILPKCKAVGDTSHMFQFQVDIQYLDISKLDTSESTDLSNMLQECSYSGLSIKGIENIDTSKSVNVENLFDNSNINNHCPANPYVYNFGNATNINGLFARHKGDLNVRRFNFSKATTINGLFANFEGTIDLNSEEVNFSEVIDFSSAFENTDVPELIFNKCTVGKTANNNKYIYNNAFKGCKAKIIDITAFHQCYVLRNSIGTFDDCINLETLVVNNFRFENMQTFKNCTNFKNITGTVLATTYSYGSHNLEDCPLTRESAKKIINSFVTVSSPNENAKFTFSQTTYDSLTEDDIAVATSKGWTIIRAA